MASFLERMAESSRARAQAARAGDGYATLERRASGAPLPLTLRLDRFDLIAELKLRSPAMGTLADGDFDAGRQVRAYAAGGAAAVSVLTEPEEFKGDLAQLATVAAALRPLGCPVMRKDFIVDSVQLLEARAAGASGVLLIAAMLSDGELDELLAAAAQQKLFVLLEAFDTADLDRIARLDLPTGQIPVLVGVNSRDLRTLAVDFARFAALAASIRRDVPAVAESGIASEDDIEAVASRGYRLALVGSALMQDGNPERTAAGFIAAGRAAASAADAATAPGAPCS